MRTLNHFLLALGFGCGLAAQDGCDSPAARRALAGMDQLQAYLRIHAPDRGAAVANARANLSRGRCNPLLLAPAELFIGTTYAAADDFRDAAIHLAQARDLCPLMSDTDTRAEVDFTATAMLLVAYVELDRSAEAIALTTRLKQLVEKGGVDTRNLIAVLQERTLQALNATDREKLRLYQKVAHIMADDEPTYRVIELARSAADHFFTGDYGQALAEARTAHQLIEQSPERSVMALAVLRIRGAIYLQLNQPEFALPIFEEGLELVDRLSPTEPAERHQIAAFCAKAALGQLAVNDARAAARTADRGLAALGKLPDIFSLDRIKAQAVAARSPAEALRIIAESDDLGGGWLLRLQQQSDPRLLWDLVRQTNVLSLLTRVDRIQFHANFARRFDDLLNPSLAVEHTVAALGLIEQSRLTLGGTSSLPLFFSPYTTTYEDAIARLYRLAHAKAKFDERLKPFGKTYAEAALYFSEATHARQHAELYGPAVLSAYGLRYRIPAALLARERALRERALQSQDPGFSVEILTQPIAARAQAETALNDYQALIETIRHDHPDFAALAFPAPINNHQLPVLADTYFVTYKVAADAVYWWLLRDRSVVAFQKIALSRSALQRLLGPYLQFIDDPFPSELGLLAAPFNQIPRNSRVVVVPDEILYHFPFELLPGPGSQPLLESFIISYAPSLLVLTQAVAPPKARLKTCLLIGDSQTENRTITIDGTPRSFPSFRPEEFERVVRAVDPASFQVTVRRSIAPDSALPQADVVHFDAHSFSNCLDPLPSLILHPSPNHPLGLLSFPEIAQLPLPGRLVVLSACSSGLGKRALPLPGEGVEGLARAFMIAGSQSVVATLRDVRTDAAASFFSFFYPELATTDPALALVAAKRKQRARYSSPSLWSPYILIGGPR